MIFIGKRVRDSIQGGSVVEIKCDISEFIQITIVTRSRMRSFRRDLPLPPCPRSSARPRCQPAVKITTRAHARGLGRSDRDGEHLPSGAPAAAGNKPEPCPHSMDVELAFSCSSLLPSLIL